MKLTKVQVTEFQSILDSTKFDVADVTCLVGKNESGKTALLRALYRLNPIVDTEGNFDVTDDYPRREVIDYQDDVAAARREPAQVVRATYTLEPDDISAVDDIFGPECLGKPSVTLQKGYSNQCTYVDFSVDTEATLKHLVEAAGLPAQLATELLKQTTAETMAASLAAAEQTEASQKLVPMLQTIAEHDVTYAVYDTILRDRIPKFLYFDEYYQ
ncbi:MAG: AAA family ATPase, partial [Acidobacteriota bacterium]